MWPTLRAHSGPVHASSAAEGHPPSAAMRGAEGKPGTPSDGSCRERTAVRPCGRGGPAGPNRASVQEREPDSRQHLHPGPCRGTERRDEAWHLGSTELSSQYAALDECLSRGCRCQFGAVTSDPLLLPHATPCRAMDLVPVRQVGWASAATGRSVLIPGTGAAAARPSQHTHTRQFATHISTPRAPAHTGSVPWHRSCRSLATRTSAYDR